MIEGEPTSTPSPDRPPAAGRDVPSSARQTLKLMKYQLREYLLSRRFVILLLLVAAIGVLITAIVAHFRGAYVSDNLSFYQSLWGGGAGFVAVLSAVFFGGDAIAGEFQNRTGYFLMGLPLRRATVYVGKYLAALVASCTVLMLFLGILVANGALYFGAGALPGQLAPSLALAGAYLVSVLAMTFLLSSLFKNGAYSFVLTAILFLAGFSLLQDFMQGLAQLQPWELISYASQTIGEVFQPRVNWGLYGVGVKAADVGGGGGVALHTGNVVAWTPGIAEGAVIMMAYWALTLFVGLALFKQEEFS